MFSRIKYILLYIFNRSKSIDRSPKFLIGDEVKMVDWELPEHSYKAFILDINALSVPGIAY